MDIERLVSEVIDAAFTVRESLSAGCPRIEIKRKYRSYKAQ